MFLLDTNVLSALRRPDRAPPALLAWAEALAPEDLFLSAITVLEVETRRAAESPPGPAPGRGAAPLDRPSRVAGLRRADPVGGRGGGPPLRRAASPDRRSERDALIAATALVHGLTVATRNEADFQPTGVAVVNPFGAPPPA